MCFGLHSILILHLSLGVKLKLNANQSTIKDKKIILIDDSLVRGTTSHKIVKMLYDAGAKEVHVRIACPEIKYPDFYGVDTPTKKELLAANKTNDEICEYIGAKSLKFLSIDGLYRAIGFDKRNEASFLLSKPIALYNPSIDKNLSDFAPMYSQISSFVLFAANNSFLVGVSTP